MICILLFLIFRRGSQMLTDPDLLAQTMVITTLGQCHKIRLYSYYCTVHPFGVASQNPSTNPLYKLLLARWRTLHLNLNRNGTALVLRRIFPQANHHKNSVLIKSQTGSAELKQRQWHSCQRMDITSNVDRLTRISQIRPPRRLRHQLLRRTGDAKPD